MNIGVIGLGKVGLALALTLRHYGRHNVVGYDKDPERVERYQTLHADPHVHPEGLMRELLAVGPIPVAPNVQALVKYSDTIIVMVDTPHPPQFDTTKELPHNRADFDYTNLRDAVDACLAEAIAQGKQMTLIISSTVSPGTTKNLTIGHPSNIRIGYSPVLISLGSVVADLLTPDMVLAGADDPQVWEVIEQIWTPVCNTAPIMRLQIVEAEIAKLAMNAYLSFKIAFANTVAQLALGTGGNADRICLALSQSRAITTDRYLRAGLSDAGACRPRDTIVLEYVSNNCGADADLWAALTEARRSHTWWLAEEINYWCDKHPHLPVQLCGTAYKPQVPYTDGSIGLLLANMLRQLGVEADLWDPVVEPDSTTPPLQALFVVTCAHPQVLQFLVGQTGPGSVIIDPLGVLTGLARPGVTLIQPGR